MAADLSRIAKAMALVNAYIKTTFERENNWDIDNNVPATLPPYDVRVVWFCYILGGWKALVCTDLPDGMYYEVTYNNEKKETYLDAYKKSDNICVPDEG